jgi:Xaa-Pro aminopeptidase
VTDLPHEDSFPYAHRIRQVAARLDVEGLEALVVTHLPNIQYLCGLETSSAVAVLTREPRLHVLSDFRYAASLDRQADVVGRDLMTPVVLATGGWEAPVAECLHAAAAVLTGVEGDTLSLNAARRLEEAGAVGGRALTLRPVSGFVEDLRRVKDAAELAILREAGARLSDVARRLLADRVVAPGRTELDVAAEVDHRMRLAGFSRPAFETIVASGPNSALPHARPTSRRLEVGDPVVLDFGGVFRRYCVDLTRTLCLGRASPPLDRMHGAVAEAQRAALAVVGPGIDPTAVDTAARDVLAEAGLAEAFGHGTGHGLGLEVHEAPRLGRPRPGAPQERRLDPGVVCTIEPGAYVVGIGGIRIEDDVAVTATGHERLTDVPLGWTTAL